MNNFLLLQEDDEADFNVSPQSDRVYCEVESQLSVLRFFGSVINMYLPVMANTVLKITGGESIDPLTDWSPEESGSNKKLPPSESFGPNSLDADPIR